jgi:hypothetical protein
MTSRQPMHDPATLHQMMATQCPTCGRQYNLPARRIGRRGKCACGAEFVIGQPHAAFPRAAAAPAMRGIEIVENDLESSGRERTIRSLTVRCRTAQGICGGESLIHQSPSRAAQV